MNRRSFLSSSVAGVAAAPGSALFAGVAGARGKPASAFFAAESSMPDTTGVRLGVATYSLREFRRDLAIKMIKELRTPYVDVKEYHLPYNDTPKELAAGRKKFEDAALKIVAGGNISLQKNDEADLRRYFDYAKTCGMPMMVCAPTHETLPTVEKLVKEYNIRAAIHNHGPEDKHFPTPQSVLQAVKNMDPRVGLCLDVGHTARTGVDVVESIREAGPRLLEMHMKDLRNFKAKESQCPVGEGIMPVVAIFKELKKMNYAGVISLEYEIDSDDPLPGMQQSFSYMRGVLAGLKG